jgi:hypothetical protein
MGRPLGPKDDSGAFLVLKQPLAGHVNFWVDTHGEDILVLMGEIFRFGLARGLEGESMVSVSFGFDDRFFECSVVPDVEDLLLE